MLNPLEFPICLDRPKRLTSQSAWVGHIPFAMFLVDLLKPKSFVELGTHHGESYCAFCQAVSALSLDTRCYAIDTWEGDPHAGFYGDEILADLRRHHDPLYSSFSELVRTTFEDARESFQDGSVDLLHIDGCHTYDAVKTDFTSWLPKISSTGVVLLHDTTVRDSGFGVWQFWDEIESSYPSFHFDHCNGLGVIAMGEKTPEKLQELLSLPKKEKGDLQKFFRALGERLMLEQDIMKKEQQLESLLNSFSWKFSAPLRKVFSFFKN